MQKTRDFVCALGRVKRACRGNADAAIIHGHATLSSSSVASFAQSKRTFADRHRSPNRPIIIVDLRVGNNRDQEVGGFQWPPFSLFYIGCCRDDRVSTNNNTFTTARGSPEGGNQRGDPDPSKPALSTRLHRSPSRGCYSISRPALVEPPEPTPRAEEAQSKHRPRKCTTEIEDRYVLQKPTTHVSPTRASNGRNEFEART